MAKAENSLDERVLVLMSKAPEDERVRGLLAGAGIASSLCADVGALCRELAAGAGAVILADEALAGDGPDRLLAALGSQPGWSDVPLILITGEGASGRNALNNESINATRVEQPVAIPTLLGVVRSALRARRHQYRMRGLLAATAQAEEGRRDAEARYLELFNAIEQGFCTLEVAFDERLRPVDYRFLEVSPSFEAQTGIADAAGRWMREIAADQDQHWFDLYGRVALTGEPCRFERNSTPLGRWWSVFAFRTGDPSLRRVAVLFHDITGRKRAEEALRESEERFRLMADAVPQIVWITDPEGRVQFLNQQWSAYTGVGVPATADDVAAAVIHPDDRPATKAAFDEALRTGGTFDVEHRIRSATGEYRWFLVRGQPYRDPQTRQITRWFGASVDIHDRRLAEEALRANQERQAYLVRLADSLRPLSESDEVQAAANRVLGEYLGVNRVLYFEVTGQDYVVERDYADGVESLAGRYPIASFGAALLESFRAGRTVVECDATTERDRPADERAAFAAIRVRGHVDVPLVKAGALVAGMTVHSCIAREWTAEELALIEQTSECTWAAVERAKAERALRAGEERFRSLFESMDEGYCVVEPVFDGAGRPVDYRYLLANPALEHHTGLRDVVGRTVRGIMPGHESHWIEAYARVAATGEPIRRVDHVADLGRWFEVAAFPVGGGQVGVLFADVTARRLAEDGLRAGEARLAEIFRHAPSFMCVLSGPEHVFERVNDRYLELIGGRQVVGLPIREALPEVAGQGYFQMLGRVYATGEPYSGTGHRVAIERGGRLEERVLDFVYQPIRDASGAVTGVLVQGIDTTERERAEAALRERDERLQLLLGTATDYAVIISDPEDRVLEWLGGAEAITGWRADEVARRAVALIFTPEDQEAGVPARETRKATEAGRAENTRWHERKDGSRFFAEGVTVALRGTAGELRGFGKVFKDATARKLAEEQLARDAMLLANVHDAVVMTDVDGVVTYWNEGAARLFGWTAREMVGRAYADRFEEPVRSWVAAEIRDRVAGSDWSGEYEDRRKDGSRVWIDSRVSSIRDASGTAVGVLGVSHDISERKRAEEAVRSRDERLQLAVAIARMGTFEIDLETDAVTVNEPGRDIYGWPDTRTTFATVRAHVHPDDKDVVMRHVGAALDPAGPGVFEVEQRVIRADGAVRWLRVRGRALFEGEGAQRRAVLCIGAFLDVTEQKQAEEELRDADRKKDDFIALLAHELRNPLAPIRNGVQVLRLAGSDPAAVRETREIMDRQITHMVRLIDDLLDVSRLNRNKMELRLSRMTLADAVDSALETARPAIDAGGHELVVDIPERAIFLEADLTRLAQVFSNLLTNSAKYTRHGGKIWLTAEMRGEAVAVSVRDSGIGIPAAALGNIFDMFSQVDRTVERTTGGLGIGLALVKGLVEMHGGKVTAASDGEGRGSTFTVELPVAATPAPPR